MTFDATNFNAATDGAMREPDEWYVGFIFKQLIG